MAISDEDLAHVVLVPDDGAQVLQSNEACRLGLRRRIYHLGNSVLHYNYNSLLLTLISTLLKRWSFITCLLQQLNPAPSEVIRFESQLENVKVAVPKW